MSVNAEIRAYFEHGVGARKVKIDPRAGEVHIKGHPDGRDTGWRFAGYVNDVLRQIAEEKAA